MVMNILCIEDNPLNMRLVRKILLHLGHRVLEATDGLSGLDIVQSEPVDLILMDINLPDIDGLEVMKRIRANGSHIRIPIVATTANAMYGDRERFLAAGCDAYISKPVVTIELKNVLRYYEQRSNPSTTYEHK